ncbi:P-loop containing nucleoside triphosphate hydrolase protein [Hypoxylon cercidicola]|nr:P-loop containing nucleoside triphosphate hydrolase protein [Hypoxylon cercidicola]
MESVSLDPTALEQLHGEQKTLLDAIDNLRKHGIDRFVDLPQIIVVGDQSSGKSSVLEAISRVRFPVKDVLCTRFATELVLRTDNHTKIDVRIHPSGISRKETHSFEEKSFDKEELPRIIENAKKVMLGGDTGFSEDVLRIEISGPDVPHLTMVDLPGFYHGEDEHQSAAGRDVVDRLVERYMARKNSIILAIVSARSQVVMQKVLTKVKQHDKKKERTLGIITKPDTLASGSQDEGNFIRLAKNLEKSHGLSLGWHVLRNRGEAETSDTDEQRDRKERDFFESSFWSSVPSKNRGVESLRKKLSGILLGHIKHSLPGLIKSIEDSINDRKTKLSRLGEPRSTTKELRMHLNKIASQFHILCLRAIEGNYDDEYFEGLYYEKYVAISNVNTLKKFRALARRCNRAFAYILETRGSRRVILPKSSQGDGIEGNNASIESEDYLPSSVRRMANRYVFPFPEFVRFKDITMELEALSSYNQGNEFPGTSNDRLAVKLFQDQSKPWEAIARRHIELVSHYAKLFVENLIDYIVDPDKDTYAAILSEIVDPFFEEKSILLESKLQELIYHYKSGYPQPLDSEFRNLLSQRRQKTLGVDALKDFVAGRPGILTKKGRKAFGVKEPSGHESESESETESEFESEFGVESLIDKAETYYQMSLRTFTDNMIVLAIENVLIKDLPSIFTTERVNQMEDEELKRLASESPEVQVERKELQEEYEDLEKGLQVCNKFKQRKSTHETEPSILAEPVDLPTTTRTQTKPSPAILTEQINLPTTSGTQANPPPSTNAHSTSNPFSRTTPAFSWTTPVSQQTSENSTTTPFRGFGTSSGGLFGRPVSTAGPIFGNSVTSNVGEKTPSLFGSNAKPKVTQANNNQ